LRACSVVGHLTKNALYRVTQKKEEEGTLINQIVPLSFSLLAAAAADYDCMPFLPPTKTACLFCRRLRLHAFFAAD
jgi:hypothetical protein